MMKSLSLGTLPGGCVGGRPQSITVLLRSEDRYGSKKYNNKKYENLQRNSC